MWLAVITGITLVVALDLNVANLFNPWWCAPFSLLLSCCIILPHHWFSGRHLFTCHKGLGLHWQLMLMHLPKAPLPWQVQGPWLQDIISLIFLILGPHQYSYRWESDVSEVRIQSQLYNEQNGKKKAWKTVLVYTKFNVLVECKDRKTGNVGFPYSCHKLRLCLLCKFSQVLTCPNILCLYNNLWQNLCWYTTSLCRK
jgi:hypothetical protein